MIKNAVGTEWVMSGVPRMIKNAVGTECVTFGVTRMIKNAVGTEWVTSGLPRIAFSAWVIWFLLQELSEVKGALDLLLYWHL